MPSGIWMMIWKTEMSAMVRGMTRWVVMDWAAGLGLVHVAEDACNRLRRSQVLKVTPEPVSLQQNLDLVRTMLYWTPSCIACELSETNGTLTVVLIPADRAKASTLKSPCGTLLSTKTA